MASDRLVTSQHVLRAVMEYDRRGSTAVLSDLEKLEPDLVEYLLETLTALHHDLARQGLSELNARKSYRRAEKTALICVIALRHAHRELWEQDGNTPAPPTDTPLSPPT
jgi:hypothetical protein